MFALYNVNLISRFVFSGGILVLIVPVPGHCIPVAFVLSDTGTDTLPYIAS